MITFPTEIAAILSSGSECVFYTARIWHRGNLSNLWAGTTNYNPVTLEGITYTDTNSIVDIGNLSVVSSVDRSLYNITLSSPALLAGNRIDIGLVGKLLEVRLGFIDPATDLPLTQSFVAYKGLIDSVTYDIDTQVDGGEALKIGAASPVNDLGMKRFIFATKEVMRERNKKDSSCDVITRGSISAAIKWGKTFKPEGEI